MYWYQAASFLRAMQSPALRNEGDTSLLHIADNRSLRILEDLSVDDDEQADTEDAVGRIVWPTAIPLLKYITEQIEEEDASFSLIVEIGSGCGVLGMGLALLGTVSKTERHILVTDHDHEWQTKNLEANHEVLEDCSIQVARLDWKEEAEIVAVQDMIRHHCSDCEPVLLVGSDVVYNHDTHGALVNTLWTLSHHQPTRIILGFPDRNEDEKHFLEQAMKKLKLGASRPLSSKGLTPLRVLDFWVPPQT